MTPAAAPARPRQMSLAADLVRREAAEAARRDVEPLRREEPQRREGAVPRRQPLGCSDGDRPTLEQHVSRVWEGLLAAGVADCPVCGAEMRRAGGGGRCGGCGSALS